MYLQDFSGHRPRKEKCYNSTSWIQLRNLEHTLSGLELLGLACAPNTTVEPTVGDNLLVLLNVGKVGVGFR